MSETNAEERTVLRLDMDSEKVTPKCPFHMKEGYLCVLIPEIRYYETCAATPCTVTSPVTVERLH